MKRRTVLKGLAAATAAPILAGCSSSSSSNSSSKNYSLDFDTSAYKTQTTTVDTGSGSKTVKYRYWEGLVYVTNPVDTAYQSLNVSVPVEIDGKAVDASNAPILLNLNVGGYMSSSVTGSGGSSGASGGMPTGAGPGGSTGGMPTGAMPSGGTPPTGASGGVQAGGGGQVNSAGGSSADNGSLALAAGYVVVAPGCRGRDNVKNGKYYGKAPAAIVDLKAAVRYVRHNKGKLPGNTDQIISTGSSAGGALSALLGASGDSSLYDTYLDQLGAAKTSDAIFASADYCPITDLEHADMAYEWMFGAQKLNGGAVNQTYSKQLAADFGSYLTQLNITGLDGFGTLTADNYGDYLLTTYLQPAATKKLAAETASARASYLAENTWITWSDNKASFTWEKFLDHVGRMKDVPAFDGFTLGNAENVEFGDESANARHFTLYSLRHATGNQNAQLDADLPSKIAMMNPMYFLARKNLARSKYWWIRVGTSDTNTSLTVVGNLAAAAHGLGDTVNSLMYWDGGHGDNEDAPAFIEWIAKITGYSG